MELQNTHREIVEACKRGNRSAQFQLYQLYSQAMYNVCMRMLNDVSDAEDMLQNSFIDVFTKLHYFRFESSIGSWIKRIVVNNCINFLKKRKLEMVEIGDHDIPQTKDNADWEEVLLTVENISSSINQLPEGYRVVLNLYLLEGYDHQEIGEILNISASTSKSQYSRAKKKLQSLLKQDRLPKNGLPKNGLQKSG
jgi:RNA polymerase sigma factor (sigma-70 family)